MVNEKVEANVLTENIFIWDIGKMMRDMAGECNNGVKALIGVEINSKDNSKMMWEMDLEIIFMKMGIVILVHMLGANDKVLGKNK